MQEVYPGGRPPPVAYDDAKTEPVVVTRWKGHPDQTRGRDGVGARVRRPVRAVQAAGATRSSVAFGEGSFPRVPLAGQERSFVLHARLFFLPEHLDHDGDRRRVGASRFGGWRTTPTSGRDATRPETDATARHALVRPVGRNNRRRVLPSPYRSRLAGHAKRVISTRYCVCADFAFGSMAIEPTSNHAAPRDLPSFRCFRGWRERLCCSSCSRATHRPGVGRVWGRHRIVVLNADVPWLADSSAATGAPQGVVEHPFHPGRACSGPNCSQSP